MELLPCPFCGGEALPTAHLTYNWFAPVCGRCNARGPSVKIERDSDPQEMRNLMNQADENWNHRASPASAPELREQVEKLTKERDTEIARNRPLQSLIKSTEETKSFLLKKSEENKEAVKQLDSERQANALLTEELAALAEQNEKFRETLSRWRYQNLSYNWCCGNCGAVDGDEHKEGCVLSLPNLATPVLNETKGNK